MGSREAAARRSGLYTLGGSIGSAAIITIRSIVVARLLAPQEVGRFALAATAITALDATSEPGLVSALVRAKSTNVRMYQTAWTALVVRGLLLTSLGVIGAPAIASLLHAPEIVNLLRVLALIPAVRAFTGLAPWLRVRELDLVPQVRIELTAVVVETLAAITLAAITRSAWALVVATMAGTASALVTSYLVPGFGPGLVLDRTELRELLAFGRWVFAANLLNFVAVNGDDLLVGRLAGTRSLGLYRTAYRLANLPTTEVSHVVSRVAFPALSLVDREAAERTEAAFRRVVVLAVGIAAPVSALLGVLAWDLVPALLGSAWKEASTPLAIMAAAGLVRAIEATGGPLFLAVGQPYWDTAMQAVRTVVLIGGVALLIEPFGIRGAAFASLASVLAALPVWALGLQHTGLSSFQFSAVVVRRLPAAVLAGSAAWTAAQAVPSDLVALLLGLLAGCVFWCAYVWLIDRELRDELSSLYATFRRR